MSVNLPIKVLQCAVAVSQGVQGFMCVSLQSVCCALLLVTSVHAAHHSAGLLPAAVLLSHKLGMDSEDPCVATCRPVLYCAVLCCAVLCCAVLCCAVLCRVVLCLVD